MSKKVEPCCLLQELKEYYIKKCEEVKWLRSNRYSQKLIDQRLKEAERIKYILDGLNTCLSSEIAKLSAYRMLGECITKHTKSDPSIKGLTIVIGPDDPRLYQYYHLITLNIPISSFTI